MDKKKAIGLGKRKDIKNIGYRQKRNRCYIIS